MGQSAELYFIAGMMALILVGSGIAVYLFVRTYRREMKEKQERLDAKLGAGRAADGDVATDVAP